MVVPLLGVGEVVMAKARWVVVRYKAQVTGAAACPSRAIRTTCCCRLALTLTPVHWHPELCLVGGSASLRCSSALGCSRQQQVSCDSCQFKETSNSPVLTNGPCLEPGSSKANIYHVLFCFKKRTTVMFAKVDQIYCRNQKELRGLGWEVGEGKKCRPCEVGVGPSSPLWHSSQPYLSIALNVSLREIFCFT